MIPNQKQIEKLWDKYKLPDKKRLHCHLVAEVASTIAKRINQRVSRHEIKSRPVNEDLVAAAALLHDIDKNVEKLPHERHPDAAVRVLIQENLNDVAELVKYHSLHFILDPNTSPQIPEEKILFLADKMVKYEVITVEERFQLWHDEDLPEEARSILAESFPKVKQLEVELFNLAGIDSQYLIRKNK